MKGLRNNVAVWNEKVVFSPYLPLIYFGKYKGIHSFILIDGLVEKRLEENGWKPCITDYSFLLRSEVKKLAVNCGEEGE